MELKPHQARMHEESAGLNERITKLAAFVHTNPTFRDLPLDEQARMRWQLSHMVGYHLALQARIDAFSESAT